MIILIGILAISTSSILVRLCGLEPLTMAAWRMILGALLVSPGWWGKPRLQASDRPWAALAGLLLGVHFASWIASLQHVSVAVSVVLVTTSPLFVAVGAHLWQNEKLTLGRLVGIGVAAFGAWAMTTGGPPSSFTGAGLAPLGAVSIAGYFLIGKRLAERVPTAPYVAAVYAWAALVLVLATLAWGAPMWGFELRQWGLLLAMGLIPQGVGHTLINRALRTAPAGLVSLMVLGEPVGATLLAWLCLQEPIGAQQAAAMVMILLGVGLAARR